MTVALVIAALWTAAAGMLGYLFGKARRSRQAIRPDRRTAPNPNIDIDAQMAEIEQQMLVYSAEMKQLKNMTLPKVATHGATRPAFPPDQR
jgi:hypothetical protein